VNIDWDKVANDADRSPSALLAEYLARAAEFEMVVIIVNKLDEEGDDNWAYETSGSAVKAEGLIGAAYRAVKRHVSGDS
jgi:hypothetical protein